MTLSGTRPASNLKTPSKVKLIRFESLITSITSMEFEKYPKIIQQLDFIQTLWSVLIAYYKKLNCQITSTKPSFVFSKKVQGSNLSQQHILTSVIPSVMISISPTLFFFLFHTTYRV